MKYALIVGGILIVPFLTLIIICAIPFLTVYGIFSLFTEKKKPEKKESSFFNWALENSLKIPQKK